MTSESGATSQRVLQEPAGELTWIPDILKRAQSAPAQRSTAHPTPQNVLREPRGPSKAGGARTRKTTLPKGSQGDEASSDHYLPIRVDCDHRSKLSGGEEASPAPPTHRGSERGSTSGAQRAERGAPRGRMAGRGAGAEQPPPRPPSALPAAGRAHRRGRSAPRSPCGRSALPSLPRSALLRAAPRRKLRPAQAAPGTARHLAALGGARGLFPGAGGAVLPSGWGGRDIIGGRMAVSRLHPSSVVTLGARSGPCENWGG